MINQLQFDELIAFYPVIVELPSLVSQKLTGEAQAVTAAEGQMLFDVGSPCTSFIMLTSGSVRVVKPDSNGHEIMLYRVRPGDTCVLTLSCLLGNTLYSARGLIESAVSGVCVSRSLFIEMVERSQAFQIFIFARFSERLLQLMELVEEVAFGKLDQRLAASLLSKGVSFRITHQQLADELGSSREVVSRILEGFAAKGVLSLERGGIHIFDVKVLHQLAGLCDRSHRHSR